MTTPLPSSWSFSAPAAAYPLLRAEQGAVIIAHVDGNAVTMQQFLAQTLALAAQLRKVAPSGSNAINLCSHPYHMLLGFAAALAAGHTTLLPANRLPATVQHLTETHPQCYALYDDFDHNLDPTPLPTRFAMPALRVDRHQWRDATPLAAFAPPLIAADFPAAVLFTSGSTGSAQPWPKPWHTLVRGAAANARASLDTTQHATLLGTIPTQHSYGLETLVMLPLQGYCALHGERPFFASDIVNALHRMPAPRVLVTTPVHLRALQATPLPWPKMAAIWSATAPLSAALASACEHTFNTHLHEIYGCTEMGTCATRRTSSHEHWTLLDEFALVQTRHDTAPPLNWMNADHVPVSLCLPDELELLGARQFKLLGRGVDLINIAGKRASLADLNIHLLAIPGIDDGVLFLPDADADAPVNHITQRTAALVVSQLSTQQIMSALRARIDAAFLPRPLWHVPALPRNDTGKLPHTALMTLFRELRATKTAHGQ